MALQDEITRIKQAKADIKSSIEAKGGSVGDGTIDTYASAIDNLPSGGADFKINNAGYLFYQGIRLDQKEEIISLISDECTNFKNMFHSCSTLSKLPQYNTSNGTDFSYMCCYCYKLSEIFEIDTSNATNVSAMFSDCKLLSKILELDFSKITNIGSFVANCSGLTDLGGFKNLGMGYTRKSANYSSYKLDLSKSTLLTHDSLMNVINKLYDLNLTYDVANGGTLYTQQLVLGATNISKLSAEELQICTDKGWTVS